MKDVKVMESPEILLGLEFVLMGVDLSACYHKMTTGYEILVTPGVLDNNVGLTLQEMIDQFNGLVGSSVLTEEIVKNKIAQDSNAANVDDINWTDIRFILKMLFLNLKRDSSAPENDVTEYALSLQIVAEDLIPTDITVINIHSLSFNIWNTQRQSVMEKMSLITPESF